MYLKTFSAISFLMLWSGIISGQLLPTSGSDSRTVLEGHIATVNLAQHFTTIIRLPDPVSSVIVGDPALFQAEHSPDEPLLVFIKPLTAAAETNVLISTSAGRHFSLLLKNGAVRQAPDLLVVCRSRESSFISESFPVSLIAESMALGDTPSNNEKPELSISASMTSLLEAQRRNSFPKLRGTYLQVAIGRIVQMDTQLMVSFSVSNASKEPAEITAPQIQLAGQVRTGLFGTKTKWTTVEQIPIRDFVLDNRQLEKGSRTDGVVVFERPTLKQSNEALFLQIADSARIDQPALTPVNFNAAERTETHQ